MNFPVRQTWGSPYRIRLLNELNDIPGVIGQRSHRCAWDELAVLLEEEAQGVFVFFISEAK